MTSNFSRMPSVTISRSKFKRKSQHKTSLKLGELTPIYIDEVLPGDTRSIDIASLIRLSTPVAPIMDNIYLDIYAFFVPNRIVWEHWKEFMGENNSSAGIYSGTEYTIPKVNIFGNGISIGSLGDHMGLPVVSANGSKSLMVSALPGRGYRRIYNRFFRDQNVIAPVTVGIGDTEYSTAMYNASLYKVAKVSDYFTRSLPYAQKGSPVTIPLGTMAPLTLDFRSQFDRPVSPAVASDIRFVTDPTKVYNIGDKLTQAPVVTLTEDGGSGPSTGSATLYADLSKATAATINTLRFAFQYQKLLEKDALYGTRYWEIIKAHFGVTAPDASLQDPELLGHRKVWINIDQVVQTTGINQATPASNELGATAAVSVTGDAGNLFTKSFTEHGYLHIYVCARHDQTYGQGVERHWSRTSRTDFYFPVFANLGAQVVKNKEIFAQGDGNTNDEQAFGFQEAWAEYRYKPSKVTGLLNPSVSGSLGYWTLANNFAALPTLGQTFIEQDRDAIGRVLQTGSSGPDFICDFAFVDTAVRPMPLYSIPGLIDHH